MMMTQAELVKKAFKRLSSMRGSRNGHQEADHQIHEYIAHYSGQPKAVIDKRIRQLDQEWSTARLPKISVGKIACAGFLVALFTRRNLALPALILPFLADAAMKKWCPTDQIMEKMGVRTMREIEAEKFALKALRGDFNGIVGEPNEKARAKKALAAVAN